MTTSDRTISQVRAILQRLDRSIDQARARRTQPAEPRIAPTPAPAPPVQPAPPAAKPVLGAVPMNGSPTPPRPPSPFGRAQPLNRPPQQQLRWGS